MDRALQEVVDAERERDLLDAARDRRGAVAAAFQHERELTADGVHHELRLGVLEEHAHEPSEPGGVVLARIQPADAHAPREAPAVEVRRQAAGRAQQR